MKKKIIICSIIAVLSLILISFTSVVGIITIEPSVKTSPLFKIRTSRAIGGGDQINPKSNFFGKEEKARIPLSFQTRANFNQNLIQKIKEIDEKIFDKLLTYVIQDIRNSEPPSPEVLRAIYIIREESNKLIHKENGDLSTIVCETLNCQTIRCNTVFAGCITFMIFTGLIKILENMYIFTETIPILSGSFILLLHQILVNMYEHYTTTLPLPN